MKPRAEGVPLPVLFGVISMLAMFALGDILQQTLRGRIEQRAVAETVRAAEFAAHVGFEPILIGRSDGPLEGPVRTRMEAAVHRGLDNGALSHVTIVDPSGLVLYSDDRSLPGTRREPAGQVLEVLETNAARHQFANAPGSAPAADRPPGTLMQVYVPLHTDDAAVVAAVAEMHVPFGHVEKGIAEDARLLLLLLAGGLGMLWLVLFRLVQVSSRRLRGQLVRNEHQALHDALTGLPNRRLLFDRVERAIAVADRQGWTAAVLLLDLDRFKEVNDTLGHHNGDRLLVEVAARLGSVLRDSDTLARLGGDEFAVLCPQIDGYAGAEVLARRIVDVLAAPVELDGLSIAVAGSVGIALAPDDGVTPEVLLQRADVAMYVAKGSLTHVARYSSDSDHYSPDRLTLLGELRQAAERDELVVHYQPKADSRTGQVCGFEALLRWQHPERGLIPPDEFIPLAEHSGLINQITPIVIEKALEECLRWGAAGHEVSVSVNVSVRDLLDRQFPARVGELLRKAEVAPALLVLELTESALMTDPDTVREVLNELKALGLKLSVDDFGSGYSSLAYLQNLPVDEVKIDRQFVRHLAEQAKDRAIVHSTVDLGRNLGLRVVAEGVEDAAAWQILADLSCDVVQGWHLGRPMPAADVVTWMRAYQPTNRITSLVGPAAG